MTVVGIRAGSDCLHQHKYETPQHDEGDENAIRDSERLALDEDAAVEEEDAKFDTRVRELLNDDDAVVQLQSRGRLVNYSCSRWS